MGVAHKRLREATQADHARLEARLDMPARVVCADERRALVAGFHALHSEIEAAVAPWLRDVPALEFDARRRSARLADDLRALGGTQAFAGPSPVRAGGVAESLGLLYVLEGSALGGRVIRRAVVARGGDLRGLSFLDPYGERLGERWRAFLAVLDAEAARPDDIEAAVAGAVAGFRHAEARLCGAPADV